MILFSIIIPTYNRAQFLKKTIETVLYQTYSLFEIIIIDDGSTDNTFEVVNEIKNEKLKYYKIKNSERGAARNYGAQIAKGDYLNFFDSDDLMCENHLSEANELIKLYNKPEWFHLGYRIETGTGECIKTVVDIDQDANLKLVRGNFLSCNGVFIRKDIAALNKFNEERSLSALEDWELWLRMAVQYKLRYKNIVTSVIVNHDTRSVLSTNKDQLIIRFEKFIQLVTNNNQIVRFYSGKLKFLFCSCYTYIALHLALVRGYKKSVIKYLWLGIKQNPAFVFERRFFAIIKHLLF